MYRSDHAVPHFQNDAGVSIIEIGSQEFMCVGVSPPFDHPHIFLCANCDENRCVDWNSLRLPLCWKCCIDAIDEASGAKTISRTLDQRHQTDVIENAIECRDVLRKPNLAFAYFCRARDPCTQQALTPVQLDGGGAHRLTGMLT